MGRRREYIDTLTFTKDELYKARRAQALVRNDGFEMQDESRLINGLSIFSTVLSLVFKLPTPVTLAAGVTSAAAGMLPNEIDDVAAVSITGEDYLDELYDFMYDNPSYDLIEVKLPFLEFVDEDFRIIQGRGHVTRVRIKGTGWIEL